MTNVNNVFNEFNIAFEYPFESRLHRLIMVYISISGSQDGSGEKLICDSQFLNFCCCNSAELISAMNYLIENGFIKKRNHGLQLGKPASSYQIAVPDKLRKGYEHANSIN